MLGQRGCRVLTDMTIRGYEALSLENSLLRVTVLPGKGTDIVEFLHKPTDCDFTWGTAWGLRPKGLCDGFILNYEGGWQEVFPNGGTPCQYNGADLEQHDEAAILPWDWTILEQSADHVAVMFTVDLLKTPFRIRKTLHLRAGEARLVIEETIENLSPFPQRAMWGHHFAFGGPFLEAGCHIAIPAKTARVENEPLESRRFQVGRYEWPHIVGADGDVHDASRLPEPGSGRDIVYLGDLSQGVYQVVSPRLGVALNVEWDKAVFPHCWFWQEFAADGFPWYGRHYNIGLEPFCGYPTHGLREAVDNGSAMTIEGGQTVSTALAVSVSAEGVDGSPYWGHVIKQISAGA